MPSKFCQKIVIFNQRSNIYYLETKILQNSNTITACFEKKIVKILLEKYRKGQNRTEGKIFIFMCLIRSYYKLEIRKFYEKFSIEKWDEGSNQPIEIENMTFFTVYSAISNFGCFY